MAARAFLSVVSTCCVLSRSATDAAMPCAPANLQYDLRYTASSPLLHGRHSIVNTRPLRRFFVTYRHPIVGSIV
jgi:hypothetical protein